MSLNLSKIKLDEKGVGFCRFEKFDNKYLVTNDIGQFLFLSPDSFGDFLQGKINKKTELYRSLREKGFLKLDSDIQNLVKNYHQRNNFLFQGPSLHIIVVTLRCNHNCIYCQVGSKNIKENGYNMDQATAKKVVDAIFNAPSPVITIEFQGGEPLINWPIMKFIIEYAKEKNVKAKKNLSIALVSNLSLLDDQKYRFFSKNKIALNTSLDGPEKIHNKNRVWPERNSYKKTVQWIQKIKKQEKKNADLPKMGALATISRHSLKYPKEIINEYLKWGFKEIHLRPLSYLGLSGKLKNQIGYSPEEFLKFWQRSMDYILEKNLKGQYIHERGSRIMLQKILTNNDPNYLDLRSPCGAGIGQMVYNFDGKVYTCDEGRMIEDDTFMIGNIKKDDYRKISSHPAIKTLCIASLLDNLPCDNCVYKPYCGTCPVQNYALYGDIFLQSANNDRCKIQKGMFQYLFQKMEDKKIRGVFKNWLSLKKKTK